MSAPVKLLRKTPRGIAALHGMLGKAQTQVHKLADFLVESAVDKPAMNFLADGSFDFDARFLTEIVNKLGSDGRKPHIEFYLSNGPWQRDHEERKPAVGTGFGTRLTRQEFSAKIKGDRKFQADFKALAARLGPVIRQVIQSKGGEVYIVPMLEDNLDVTTFSKLKQLAAEAIPERGVHFGRNPAKGDFTIPAGCFMEVHDLNGTKPGKGIYCNDGPEGNFTTMKLFRDAASTSNSVFIGFSNKNQGERDTPVRNRNYHVPSSTDHQQYLSLLRG